jgi:serine/threonine protein kinase
MGEIYLARQAGMEGFQREVVLKRIHRRLSDHPRAVRMFLDEARLAAALSHPNVVQIYDVCQEEETFFIVMERIRGTSLRELAETATRQGKMIPMEQSVNIIIQALEGLRYAHGFRDETGRSLKIVHRDICPTNILISYDGAVKLVDFGIARAEGQLLQESGLPSGKFAYMSPEMLRGDAVDARSDLRSVGVLLYELTVGQRLFRATSRGAMQRIIDDPIPPPTFSRAGYPVDLEIIVMRALEQDPSDRFPTAEAMLEELEQFAFNTGLRASRLRLGRFVSQIMGVRDRDAFSVEETEVESAAPDPVQEELDFDHDGLFEPHEEEGSDAEGSLSTSGTRTSSVVEAIQQANEAIAELVSAAEDDDEEGQTVEIFPSKQARLRADTVPAPQDDEPTGARRAAQADLESTANISLPRKEQTQVVTDDMIELEEASQPEVEEEIDFDLDLTTLESSVPSEPPEASSDLKSALAEISQELKAGEASDRQREEAIGRLVQTGGPETAERPSTLIDTLLGKESAHSVVAHDEPRIVVPDEDVIRGDELELVDSPGERPLDDLERSDVVEGDALMLEPDTEGIEDDDDGLDDHTIELDPASESDIEEIREVMQAVEELDDLDGPTIQDLPRVVDPALLDPALRPRAPTQPIIPEEAATVPAMVPKLVEATRRPVRPTRSSGRRAPTTRDKRPGRVSRTRPVPRRSRHHGAKSRRR